MRVEQTVGPSGTFGPLFGVEAYDGSDTVGLLGLLGVDASNGEILYVQQDTGELIVPGPTVAFGTWHNYAIELDFLSHQYRVFADGVLLGTEGFVDQNIVAGGLDHFTDADISAIAAAGDLASQSLPGTAFFDNFTVVDSNLPIEKGDFNSDGVLNATDIDSLAFAGALRSR